MSLIDQAFLNGIGYDVALPDVLQLVREDSPLDTKLPLCLTYKRFRGALMPYLAKLLFPTPPPGLCHFFASYPAQILSYSTSKRFFNVGPDRLSIWSQSTWGCQKTSMRNMFSSDTL